MSKIRKGLNPKVIGVTYSIGTTNHYVYADGTREIIQIDDTNPLVKRGGEEADCSKGTSMMMQPVTSMQSMQPTGDVDKDFAQMMMAHNEAMMAMAKAEVACGKDPKAKAMAQKYVDQAHANAAELRAILGGGL